VLTQTCEYALRAVTYIAHHAGEGAVLAREIASAANVPYEYLQKLLTELVKNRLLASTRGIGGGFRLAKPAGKIRLLDVVRPFDDVMQRSLCPFGNEDCGKRYPCPVHDRWSVVVETYKSFLETTTVADLVVDASVDP
jgi:Rrf2 family protein